MNICIEEACMIEGQATQVGEVVSVDDVLGRQMVAYGRAHEATRADIAAWTKAQKADQTTTQTGTEGQ